MMLKVGLYKFRQFMASLICMSGVLASSSAYAIDYVGDSRLPEKLDTLKLTCPTPQGEEMINCTLIIPKNEGSTKEDFRISLTKKSWEQVIAESEGFKGKYIPVETLYDYRVFPKILNLIRSHTRQSNYDVELQEKIAKAMVYGAPMCSFWTGNFDEKEASAYMCGYLPESQERNYKNNSIVLILLMWPVAVVLMHEVEEK